VLAELIRRQLDSGMKDAEFSQRLGIPKSTWVLTRTGHKRLGPRVVRAALRLWPDLTQMAMVWLTEHEETEEAVS
jgi:hypothetical protein